MTRNEPHSPKSSVIGKHAGKQAKAGDPSQVRNPKGSLSAEFTSPGS